MKYTLCSYYNMYLDFKMGYIILSNKGISFNKELNQILNLNIKERNVKSIDIIKNMVEEEGELFIKNDNFLEIGDLIDKGTYEMTWDENKSGVNPFEYAHLYIWNAVTHI